MTWQEAETVPPAKAASSRTVFGARLAGLALALVLAACGGRSVELPNRSAVEVQVDEQEIADLLVASDEWFSGTCEARLLGVDGPTRFAWAQCSAGSSGWSGPVRIDGDSLTLPGDGALYGPDVRELFPAALADAILNRDERIFP